MMINEIQRYNYRAMHDPLFTAYGMFEDDHGSFVKYDDVLKVVERHINLINGLQNTIDSITGES